MRHLRLGLAANPSLPPYLIDRLLTYEDECVDPANCDLATTLGDRTDLSREQAMRLVAHDDAGVGMGCAAVLTAADVDPARWPLVALALLENSAGPPAWARHFATVPETWFRERLAGCPDLPADVSETLAADPDVRVVAELAYWATPTVAAGLARHPHAEVRSAVAANERTPPSVLAALVTGEGLPPVRHCMVCDQEPVPYTHARGCDRPGCALRSGAACDGSHQSTAHELLVRALENPATPASAVLAFAGHPSDLLRRSLAARRDLPSSVYEQLAHDPSAWVRRELAENPATGGTTVRVLAADPDPGVRRPVAHHPRLPLDTLIALAGTARTGPVPLPRIAAATRAEIDLLAGSRNPAVRALVAERHDLPDEVRDRLATDPDAKVVRALAPHPGLPEAALRAMTDRFGAQVAGRVAQNPDASPAFLEELALRTPPVRKVLRAVAARPGATPASLVACLADPRVRTTAARHPSLPQPVLIGLLDHPDHDLAEAAAANPALPVGEMARLIPAPGRP